MESTFLRQWFRHWEHVNRGGHQHAEVKSLERVSYILIPQLHVSLWIYAIVNNSMLTAYTTIEIIQQQNINMYEYQIFNLIWLANPKFLEEPQYHQSSLDLQTPAPLSLPLCGYKSIFPSSPQSSGFALFFEAGVGSWLNMFCHRPAQRVQWKGNGPAQGTECPGFMEEGNKNAWIGKCMRSNQSHNESLTVITSSEEVMVSLTKWSSRRL